MSTQYILPLKAPAPLPASWVDVVTFKVWKNTLISHIQQDANNFLFMLGGIYATWRAAMSGVRIRQVDDADTEKVTLDGKSAHNQISAADLQASLALLLNKTFEVHLAYCYTLPSHRK